MSLCWYVCRSFSLEPRQQKSINAELVPNFPSLHPTRMCATLQRVYTYTEDCTRVQWPPGVTPCQTRRPPVPACGCECPRNTFPRAGHSRRRRSDNVTAAHGQCTHVPTGHAPCLRHTRARVPNPMPCTSPITGSRVRCQTASQPSPAHPDSHPLDPLGAPSTSYKPDSGDTESLPWVHNVQAAVAAAHGEHRVGGRCTYADMVDTRG